MLTQAGHAVGDDRARQIPGVLRAALGPRWEFTAEGCHIRIEHPERGTPYRPPRRSPTWDELLDSLDAGFTGEGVPRDVCLPLRWGRETELTISAVQALDPLLKDGQARTYRHGFLAQPVVRFTGRREAGGDLEDGFLTSFVNVSRVQPVSSVDEYGPIFDSWLSVLSRLGFHARHLSVHGELVPWRRRQVEGVTLRFRHLGHTLGDVILLWNADRPERMAVDLGTGLERLAWACTQENWHRLIYGRFAEGAPAGTLDAVRTATLLLGQGINPAARGAGGITRRVIRTIDRAAAPLGVGALVRDACRYWSLFCPLRPPWPEIARVIEEETLAD